MSKRWAERLVALCLILASIYILSESIGLPQRAGAFPQFAAYGVILLSLGIVLRSFRKGDPRIEGNVRFSFSYQSWKPAIIIICAVFYGFAIFEVGFYSSSFVFFFVVTYLTGLRSFRLTFLTALVLFPLMYIFFSVLLDANMPEGILV